MSTQRNIISHGIRDNHTRGQVADFLAEKMAAGSQLSVVSAYFTIYAYDTLSSQLDQIDHLNFLFGEPRFIASLDPDKTDKKAFKIEDEGMELANRLQQKEVARRCAAWLRDKVDIRSVRQANLLHGKLYHIDDGRREHALLGSSNFTRRGLGLSDTPNIELNLIVDGDRDRADLKQWFDEIWSDEKLVADVKADVLRYLEQLYVDHAPEFVYFKTLYHVFERFLSGQEADAALFDQTAIIDTEIWKALFDFQKDGVKGAIHKINQHNGCILADSVGLGKTYSALAVIKYYELRNHRVLVLCPKKLRDNWTVYLAQNNSELNPFLKDRFAYTVLSHTDLSRDSGRVDGIDLATLNWGNFDLIVIDESHNFRNNTKGKRDEEGNLIKKSRYERLMDDIIKSGVKTKVLLLSATPVNNDLKDLRNQIYFVTEGQDAAFAQSFGINSIKDTLTVAQKTFMEWARRSGERDARDLMERLSAGFFTLLDELTIARSRKHIQKYYKASMAQIGHFPKRRKPESVFSEIDLKGRFLSYDKLNDEIDHYQLSIFKPSKYVLEAFKAQYEDHRVQNFSQENREKFLIGMMKVNFLKRLESSVRAFAITMQRTVSKIEDLEERLKQFLQHQAKTAENIQLDFFVEPAEEDEELTQAFQAGTKLKYRMEHMDVAAWLADLATDKQQLSLLADAAQAVDASRDAKLAELKRLIENKVGHPSTNTLGEENRKVIVFCAFADTAAYLYEELEDWTRNTLGVHIALVSGGARPNRSTFGQADFTHILTNFAPRAKQRGKMKSMPQDGEIDLLIATDCISEGQNLQDCDYLINYDIHWNPVRIIQRFGRIDRIGSPNNAIQLVNFWPTPDLNKYINLKNRVEARMALVDIAATAEDNILQAEDLEDLIKQDMRYRDKQLLRLKDEVLDLEDFNESVALGEFTLDDFRMELATYIEANREKLEEAPFGLYAVVPPHFEYSSIKPGIIYCLKQHIDAAGNETVNPLQPYFLVYIRDDGEVRYNFTAPKQILEIFRAVCQGQIEPYAKLCKLFDEETAHGQDMSRYSGLLDKAVAAIAAQFGRKNAGNLFSGRSGKLLSSQSAIKATTDFDLITWLVIKHEQ
ncbi:TPA: DEAD/DEAH box helicase family protein [Stenotrophomonas maltophilia]|nr:DEAD/DEAH box helicase family protein [Stenotrophomonas maltophilia]HDS1025423.1 DEAD/DEAH box helicase family protein [Stenotrophomonas maltophilia]HDS1028160.1 DEAD/DEAH box helicase family protein [Stenotrophomonas maltophilia]HDS1029673.1 DEAD/DEAH box helicase family protein [Stenotrophomonas maltophilia]HDS1033911.1 DEAD/DEAH box helicase family protein [Stenotrophomonas maltophilia]